MQTNVLTIPINLKEYFEKYKDFSVNKKHKGVNPPSSSGIDFEEYSERLATLHEYCFDDKPK